MEIDEILRLATITIDRAQKRPEREEDLYTPRERKHPKGAVKVGYDTAYFERTVNATAINLRGLTFTLLPVLYALGMASKEYLVKYRGLGGGKLRDAIKRDYMALGGVGGVFDVITESSKYGKCLVMPTSPDRELWPYISLEYVGEKEEDRYPCPLRFRLDTEALAPEFEIWISGEQLEKRKEYKRLIGELNSFFELGTNRGMITAYFGNVDRNGRITENKEQLFKGGFAMNGVVKKGEG